MTEIILDWPEVLVAATIGIARHIESKRKGMNDAHGFDGDGQWDIDIEGAAAEMAFAKAAKTYWSGSINTFKESDIGNKIQIRTVKNHKYSLIVRKNDNDNHYYFLVIGSTPKFIIRGYILGKEAKQTKWLKNPNHREAAYFVPQDALHEI
jgi:hypothetical protein